MPIDTLDKLVASYNLAQIRPIYKASISARAAGTWSSLWMAGGLPGAATTPPTGNGEIPTNATAGAMRLVNPASGNKLYLARFSITSSAACLMIFYDRLWHNSGFSGTVTTAQTIPTPPTLTRPDSVGHDVELWGEIYTAIGATACTMAASYTNSAGVSGRTATYSKPAAALIAGEMFPFSLQSGDTGVRTVASVTLSASTGTAGNFGLVLLRRIAEVPILLTNVGGDKDAFFLGMPEVHPSTCLALMLQASTTSTGFVTGSIELVEG